MARTLLGEIFNQVTGKRDKPSRIKNREHIEYRTKQAQFENRKAYEIAQHRAKSKGWK